MELNKDRRSTKQKKKKISHEYGLEIGTCALFRVSSNKRRKCRIWNINSFIQCPQQVYIRTDIWIKIDWCTHDVIKTESNIHKWSINLSISLTNALHQMINQLISFAYKRAYTRLRSNQTINGGRQPLPNYRDRFFHSHASVNVADGGFWPKSVKKICGLFL